MVVNRVRSISQNPCQLLRGLCIGRLQSIHNSLAKRRRQQSNLAEIANFMHSGSLPCMVIENIAHISNRCYPLRRSVDRRSWLKMYGFLNRVTELGIATIADAMVCAKTDSSRLRTLVLLLVILCCAQTGYAQYPPADFS